MNTCFYFQILCLRETVSTEVLCKTEMETKREHRIVCVCPATSLHTLVTLYTPFPHLSVNCCAVKLHWSMLMYEAWRHRATGTWSHSICWPSCSVLDVQKKKKRTSALWVCSEDFSPDTEWLPTTLSHSCGWMEHIPSSETMCVKGLSKIWTGTFFGLSPRELIPSPTWNYATSFALLPIFGLIDGWTAPEHIDTAKTLWHLAIIGAGGLASISCTKWVSSITGCGALSDCNSFKYKPWFVAHNYRIDPNIRRPFFSRLIFSVTNSHSLLSISWKRPLRGPR